jgi:NADP-dependent 3-hydroxy acid dehydrogenase YdfG
MAGEHAMPKRKLGRNCLKDSAPGWGRMGMSANPIPADSFARAVAFAISQPEDVDINEIVVRRMRQEL